MEDLQLLQADEVLAGQGGQLVPAQPQLLQQGQVGEGSVWHLVRELLIKKMQHNYRLLLKRSDPPTPRLLELLGHFFIG